MLSALINARYIYIKIYTLRRTKYGMYDLGRTLQSALKGTPVQPHRQSMASSKATDHSAMQTPLLLFAPNTATFVCTKHHSAEKASADTEVGE